MSVAVYLLWRLGMLLHFAAAGRMVLNGLFRRIPTLFAYLLLCASRSILLMMLRTNPPLYKIVYTYSLPFVLIAQYAAIIAAFWWMTEHYKNFRNVGTWLLEIGAGIGLLAATVLQFALFPSSHGLREWALATQHYMGLAMAIAIPVSGWMIPRSSKLPISHTAARVANMLALDAGLGFATSLFARVYGRELPNLAALVPSIAGVLLGILWIRCVKPMAEEEAPPVMGIREASEELRLVEADIRLATAQVRQAAHGSDR